MLAPLSRAKDPDGYLQALGVLVEQGLFDTMEHIAGSGDAGRARWCAQHLLPVFLRQPRFDGGWEAATRFSAREN